MEATSQFVKNESLISAAQTGILGCIAPILLACLSGVYGMKVFYIPLTLIVYLFFIQKIFENRGLLDAIFFTVVCGTLCYAGYKYLGPTVSIVLTGLTITYFFLMRKRDTAQKFIFITGHVLVIICTGSLLFIIPPHMLWYPKNTAGVHYNEIPQWLVSPFSYTGKLEYAPPLTGRVIIKTREEQAETILTNIEVTYSVASQMLNTAEKWLKLRDLEQKGITISAPPPDKTFKTAVQECLRDNYPFIHFKVKIKE